MYILETNKKLIDKLSDLYFEYTDFDEYNEDDVNVWLKKDEVSDILSDVQKDERDSIISDIKTKIKSLFNDEENDEDDAEDEEELNNEFKDMITSDPDSIDDIIDEIENSDEIDDDEKEALLKRLNDIKKNPDDISKIDDIFTNESLLTEKYIIRSVIAYKVIKKSVKRHAYNKNVELYKEKIKNTEDKEEKAQLMKNLHDYQHVMLNDKGKILTKKKDIKKNIKKAQKSGKLENSNFDYKDFTIIKKDAARERHQEAAKNFKEKTKEKIDAYKDSKKDDEGNTLKKQTIKDPETGEKKKVVMHIGPKGGKFYYPEGSPKDAEHKVYVESTCQNYIYNSNMKTLTESIKNTNITEEDINENAAAVLKPALKLIAKYALKAGIEKTMDLIKDYLDNEM